MSRIYDLISEMNKLIREIRDRVVRIETRLTKYMEARGFNTQAQLPQWQEDGRCVEIPTPNCTLQHILDAIPNSRTGQSEIISLVINGKIIARLVVG